MIESWDDVLTADQYSEISDLARKSFLSLVSAFNSGRVGAIVKIEYMDGMRLCFYPAHEAQKFGIEKAGLVAENFRDRDGKPLIKIENDCSRYNAAWAISTFRLTPKFLKDFLRKLHEKVSE